MSFWSILKKGSYKYEVIQDHQVDLLDCAKGWDFQINFTGQPDKPCAKVKAGKMTVYKGYSWNGADYIDRLTTIQGTQEATLVHDVLCQAMRKTVYKMPPVLPNTRANQKCADHQLYCILREFDKSRTANTMYSAVRSYQSTKRIIAGPFAILFGIVGGIFGFLYPFSLARC